MRGEPLATSGATSRPSTGTLGRQAQLGAHHLAPERRRAAGRDRAEPAARDLSPNGSEPSV